MTPDLEPLLEPEWRDRWDRRSRALVNWAMRLRQDRKPLKRLLDGVNGLLIEAERCGAFPAIRGFERSYHADYPALAEVEANHRMIREEAEALLALRHRMPDVSELAGKYNNTKRGVAWKSVMLKSGRFIEDNCRLAPRTADLLRRVPGLYTAFFSVLEPGQYIKPHWGYWKGFLRYHLGVIIPGEAEGKCWLRVNPSYRVVPGSDVRAIEDGVRYFWKEGEGVLFDDVFLHDAMNASDAVRVVLYLDVARAMNPALDRINRSLCDIMFEVPPLRHVRENALLASPHAPR
ncbi:MAG: aspartyl/asparaginyl beta-hydroxylase domain-containing protein [Myxococcota bacterium]